MSSAKGQRTTGEQTYGQILCGSQDEIRRSYEKWHRQPVDQEMTADESDAWGPEQTTLAKPVSVTGPGTFLGKAESTLKLWPTPEQGWWFDRRDLPGCLPIRVSVNTVWRTVRNVVLCSGSPHNYMRMVEHIVALKAGMGIDNVVIGMESGDPPLFERGSLDLVEAVEQAGIEKQKERATYLSVKEPVTVVGPRGSFLTFLPAEDGARSLWVDCAVDFRSAIGRQRVQFPVTKRVFRAAALARTNTTLGKMAYCKTVGKIFADTRNLGYTTRNILVAGRWRYFNVPQLMHNGKSLEAVWHRAALDLLAAVALIDRGRLAGKIISYKAGHSLDVQMIRELYKRDLLEEL